MINRYPRTYCLLLPVVLYSALSFGTDASGAPDFIVFDDNTQRFSAQVRNQPFKWVIEQLEQAAGIEFTVFEDQYAPVSAEFDGMPLQKAIAELLHGTSYMINVGNTVQISVLSREGMGDSGYSDSTGIAPPPAPRSDQRQVRRSMATGAWGSMRKPDREQSDSADNPPGPEEMRDQPEEMSGTDVTGEDLRQLQEFEGQVSNMPQTVYQGNPDDDGQPVPDDLYNPEKLQDETGQ